MRGRPSIRAHLDDEGLNDNDSWCRYNNHIYPGIVTPPDDH